MKTEHKKLDAGQLDAIWAALAEAGQAKAVADLKEHVAALEEENMLLSQYYEEFLIPVMEEQPIGRPGPRGSGDGSGRGR